MPPTDLTTPASAPHELEVYSAERTREELRASRAAEAARVAQEGGLVNWLLEGRGWNYLRATLDALTLVAAVLVALHWSGDSVPSDAEAAFYLFPPLVMAMLALRGMYARQIRVSILDGVAPVVSAISFSVMFLVVLEIYVFQAEVETTVLAHLWVPSVLFVGLGRVAAAGAQRYARSRTLVGRPTLIVGAGVIGAKVAQRLQENPDYGLRPIGYLDGSPPQEGRVAHLPVLGGQEDVAWVASLTGAQHIVLAFSEAPDSELVTFAQRCTELGLEVSMVPRLFEALNARLSYEAIGGMPLMALRPTRPYGSRFAVKHAIDRSAAAVALTILGPLMLGIALIVKLTSPGPVCFRQRRVGRDGQAIDLLKFRSMRPARPGEAFSLAAGSAPGGVEGIDRRTSIGRFLRRSSLDELPQLLNVLRGDMSLVGPRPERPEFVELFSRDIPRYAERHRVKCGITGWAQVHGLRGQTSLTDRVEWDNYYIEHWSFALDAKILALTFVAIFRDAE